MKLTRFQLVAVLGVLCLPGMVWAQSASDVTERDRSLRIEACTEAGGSELSCKAALNPVRLDVVEVFGDRDLDGPGASSVLWGELIAEVTPDHPAEILNAVPGVNVQTNSGQEHLIAIRSPVLTGGAGQGSFLVLENGVPIRAAAFGNVNGLLELHFETAELLEVVRGPGSAKYGSNAVHGLVNVILGGPKRPGVDTHLSLSSLGRYKADLVADQGHLVRGALSLQKDTGWRDATGLVQTKGSLQAETSLSGWAVTLWGTATALEQETADFIEGERAYEDDALARGNDDPLAYRNAWSARAGARLDRRVADGQLSLTSFARLQQMDFRQHFLPNKSFEKNGQGGLGVLVRYEKPIWEGLTARIGLDLDQTTGYLRETQDDPFGFFPGDARFPVGVHYDYSIRSRMSGLWSELDWTPTEQTRLVFGLRGESHHYDYSTDVPAGVYGRFRVPGDRTDSFDFVTPKLGVVHQLNPDVAVFGNYSRGARAPQASDLYRIQALQTPADADVETLESVELGLRGRLDEGRLIFEVVAYDMAKDNFFFRDANGLNVTDGKTRHTGIELGVDWSLSPGLRLRGGISWSDQTYDFDREVGNGSEVIRRGNRIDTAPEWLGDVSLIWSPDDRFDAILSAEHVGDYQTNPANTRSYPGHTVLGLRGQYRMGEDLEVYVNLRNLLDERYADRADFAFGNDRYFPGEPRNLTVGVRRTFR